MPRKKRIIAPRILYVLEENKKVGMIFSDIFRAMARHDWFHNQNTISSNLKYLMKENKIVWINKIYSIIQVRENGTKFAVIIDPVEKTVEI